MKRVKRKIWLYLVPIIIVFMILRNLYCSHYESTVDIIEAEYTAKIDLIEQSIYNETKYTDIISKVAERDIQVEMEKNSQFLIDKYIENPNILEWDIKKLKEELGKMDIYILNEELKVISSSIEEEIGLDFSIYNEFSKVLRDRLDGDEFHSDAINFSIKKGELKKYSYIPTPDNKYLIELSVSIRDSYPELATLNIVYLSKDLIDDYPFVEDIRVYKFNKNGEYSHELNRVQKRSSKDWISKKEQDKYVKRALETDEVQEHIVLNKGNTHRYKYIPYNVYYGDNTLSWWESYVIKIIYNDQIFMDKISHQKNLAIRNMSIISILYFGFAFTFLYSIGKNREIAHKDYLTKLPNRKRFKEVMKYEMKEADKSNTIMAILFFDLDNFKKINDTFGHSIGDKVLQEVANRMQNEIRKVDIVSRLGGDEFVGLITNLNSKESIFEIADRMSRIFEPIFKIDSKEIKIKPSIGISIYPEHGNTPDELVLRADYAMYEAKQNSAKYKIYHEKMENN